MKEVPLKKTCAYNVTGENVETSTGHVLLQTVELCPYKPSAEVTFNVRVELSNVSMKVFLVGHKALLLYSAIRTLKYHTAGRRH